MTAVSSKLEGLFQFTPRPANEKDLGFVLETMAHSLSGFYGLPRHTQEDMDIMREACRRFLVDNMNAGAELIIAPAPADAWVIWGWALALKGAPLFAYVKDKYRKARIATRLFAHLGVDMQREEGHMSRWMTYDLRKIAVRGKWRVRYVPVL